MKRVEYERKIVTLVEQLDSTNREKCSLDKSNKKLMEEVHAIARGKRQLEEQVKATLCQLKSKEDDLREEGDILRTKEKKYESELSLLQKQLKEQSHMLKEYQDKVLYCCSFSKHMHSSMMQVTMTTGKMQKLSQQIKNDRSVSERMKKSHASEITLQSTEAKKLAMEVTKLKVHRCVCITIQM